METFHYVHISYLLILNLSCLHFVFLILGGLQEGGCTFLIDGELRAQAAPCLSMDMDFIVGLDRRLRCGSHPGPRTTDHLYAPMHTSMHFIL